MPLDITKLINNLVGFWDLGVLNTFQWPCDSSDLLDTVAVPIALENMSATWKLKES